MLQWKIIAEWMKQEESTGYLKNWSIEYKEETVRHKTGKKESHSFQATRKDHISHRGKKKSSQML